MSTVNKTTMDAARKKRVKKLKKMILWLVIIMLLLPTVLCIVLFSKIGKLQGQLDDISKYIAQEQTTENEETESLQNPSDGDDEEQTTSQTQINPIPVTPYKNWTEEQKAIIEKYKGLGEGRTIYLTFDDGPSVYTEEILEILDYYDIKATFFVVGKEDTASLSRYSTIAKAGHTLGLHSYSHRYADIYSSLSNFVSDLKKIQTLVYDQTGVTCTLYRFPGGSSTSKALLPISTFISYLNKNGFTYFDWNSTCGDGETVTVLMENIVTNVMEDAIKHKDVVALLHDSKSKRTTVDGLPLLIETLINAGFEIKQIDEGTPLVQHRTAE